ncbi:MAG: hypothetical protein RL213_1750 [Bacteroidota bacterium]|jgi:hypothetical protein
MTRGLKKNNANPSCLRTPAFSAILRFIFLSVAFVSSGQSASAESEKDSLTAISRARANKAALYSAILPGAGQVYNHRYWKVPLVVGGFVGLYYVSDFNNTYYKDFRTAYIARTDNDSTTSDNYPLYTLQEIRVRMDYYRRNRDLSYILMGGFYILTIVDAYVDAQLKDFDVSDRLSLKIHPEFSFSSNFAPAAGMKIAFCLH